MDLHVGDIVSFGGDNSWSGRGGTAPMPISHKDGTPIKYQVAELGPDPDSYAGARLDFAPGERARYWREHISEVPKRYHKQILAELIITVVI